MSSHSCSIVQSFELVLSLYAQQVPLNEIRIFNDSGSRIVIVAERVSIIIIKNLMSYYYIIVASSQRSVQSLVENGRSFTIGKRTILFRDAIIISIL